VIVENLLANHSFALPAFYAEHKIVATADVLIKGKGQAWGVLEVDSPTPVPEPSSLLLLIGALIGAAAFMHRGRYRPTTRSMIPAA
jgi:hypothetical protein